MTEGQIPGRVKKVRTEVSIELANRWSLGIFVRRFWCPGERQAMTECPGLHGEVGTSEVQFELLRTLRG